MTRQFLRVMDKFRAAGTEGGTDCRQQMRRIGCKLLSHHFDGCGDDVVYAAAPAAVDIGRHLPLRIKEHDRLAVRLLDQQANPGNIGDKGVAVGNFHIRFRFFRDHLYLAAMYLPAGNKNVKPKALPDPFPVFFDPPGIIIHPVTDIEGSIRWRAYSAMTVENTMPQGGAVCKCWEGKGGEHGR